MARNGAPLFCLVLFIFVAACLCTESEVKTSDRTTLINTKSSLSSNDSSTVENPNLDSTVAHNEMKGEVGNQGVKTVPVSSNSSKELSSKDDPEVLKSTNNSTKEMDVKEKEENKQGNSEGFKSKEVPKKGTKDEDVVHSKPSRKENARGEECDSSNMCRDVKNKLIACLRVPGNDSPDYSLLIQNKGTSPLVVKISAPKYVRLEESTIQLLQKEDKKVKVSIGDGDNNTVIILSTGNGQCSLNFRDLILHNYDKKTTNSMKFAYTDLSSRAYSIFFISLAALFLVGSIIFCVKLGRKNLISGGDNNPKYEKLETELPVTAAVTNIPSKVNDGWDNSWGDDSWDDEEAPRTPSMPLTPSLSSKGLAARRSAKEGWKD